MIFVDIELKIRSNRGTIVEIDILYQCMCRPVFSKDKRKVVFVCGDIAGKQVQRFIKMATMYM